MTNLGKLEYAALDITGKNYLTWVLDTKIHLEAGNLGDTIREESSSSSQNRAKAMIFIRRHLDEALKMAEYNSALFRITSQMKLCGDTITDEILLEKTYNTFHANNVLLQQQKGKNHGGQFHNQVQRHNSGPRNSEGACHRYGGNGHWVRTCRTPKHLVELYQASLKKKGVKTNFLDQAKPMDIPDPVFDLSGQFDATHLDVSDFIMERGNEVYRSD
ncbi:uncharacterized protein LOC126595201 [Malus sylvestris]|uniref:uncharacterized protein LOC126595201 n=1 Tax=Malus sylvestris TaxID=3752 RepID=UPI0021AD0F55|nr:uncharacterized protein LOC126595201 [Malus sylvestris]